MAKIPLALVMVATTLTFIGMVLGGFLPSLSIGLRTSNQLVGVVSGKAADSLRHELLGDVNHIIAQLVSVAPTMTSFPTKTFAVSTALRILKVADFIDYIHFVSKNGRKSYALLRTEVEHEVFDFQFNTFDTAVSSCRIDYNMTVDDETDVGTEQNAIRTFCGYNPLQEFWMDTMWNATGMMALPVVPLAGFAQPISSLLLGATLKDTTGAVIGWMVVSYSLPEVHIDFVDSNLGGRSIAMLLDARNAQFFITSFESSSPTEELAHTVNYDPNTNRPNISYYYLDTPLPRGHPLAQTYVRNALNAFRPILLDPSVELDEHGLVQATVEDPDSSEGFDCKLYDISNELIPTLRWRLIIMVENIYYTHPIVTARTSIAVTISILFVLVLLVQTGLLWEVTVSIKSMGLVVHETVTKTRKRKGNAHDAEEERTIRKSMISEIAEMQDKLEHFGQSMNQYVPTEVVAELILSGRPAEVFMTPTTATILFVDIESFTKMCETLEPEDLNELLAYYYEAQCETVAEHGGVVDKFIGDCVMALWGAPRVVDSPELRAVCAGLHLWDNMKRPEAQQIQTDLGVDIKVRVGIAKGTVLAGSMGSTTRLAYTVLGDPVNLAARLEAANKKFGTRILINGTVMEGCVRDEHMLRLVYRDLGTVQVYGKDNAERVFQVIGVRSGVELGNSSTSNKNPVIASSKEDPLARDNASISDNRSMRSDRESKSGRPHRRLTETERSKYGAGTTGSSTQRLTEGAYEAINEIRQRAAELTLTMEQIADAAMAAFSISEKHVQAAEQFNMGVMKLLQGEPDQAVPLFLASATLYGKQDALCKLMLNSVDSSSQVMKLDGGTATDGEALKNPTSTVALTPSGGSGLIPVFHLAEK